jgi:hypothetical protein
VLSGTSYATSGRGTESGSGGNGDGGSAEDYMTALCFIVMRACGTTATNPTSTSASLVISSSRGLESFLSQLQMVRILFANAMHVKAFVDICVAVKLLSNAHKTLRERAIAARERQQQVQQQQQQSQPSGSVTSLIGPVQPTSSAVAVLNNSSSSNTAAIAAALNSGGPPLPPRSHVPHPPSSLPPPPPAGSPTMITTGAIFARPGAEALRQRLLPMGFSDIGIPSTPLHLICSV